jgi:hypothetical protein
MIRPSKGEARFWAIAEPLLSGAGVTRSTMMGSPCLRVSGKFFASFDRRTGTAVVKLSRARVDELLTTGQARPFAPSGRPFREWAAIDADRSELWRSLLDEALAFVADRST